MLTISRCKDFVVLLLRAPAGRTCRIALWALCCVLSCNHESGAETAAGKSGLKKDRYELKGTISLFAQPVTKDSIYRYSTEAGVRLYSEADFEQAEKLFAEAIQDAEKKRITGPTLAVMFANLAAAQREQRKYGQSRATFRLALAALRDSTRQQGDSVTYTRALNYIASQYAGVLRKLRLEAEAKMIEEDPMALLAARTDREPLIGRVELDAPSQSPLVGRANKMGPGSADAEKIDFRSGTPFEDEKPTEPPTSSGGGGSPANIERPGELVQLRESITIRQTMYLQESRIMYDALKTAMYYMGKGMDVTVMLDRSGLQVANRHDPTEVPEGDKLVPVKAILVEFLQKGGTVLASESWSKKFGYVTGGNMPSGIKLLSDDEMRDELFKRRGTIIDY